MRCAHWQTILNMLYSNKYNSIRTHTCFLILNSNIHLHTDTRKGKFQLIKNFRKDILKTTSQLELFICSNAYLMEMY